jgi:hypothetical protein
MPQVSLIVCIYGDRAPLARLLELSTDCYDELLVIHDGPDFQDVRSLVIQHGGRFLERPRAFSQEPHIPFALGEATHDWILRFDSDEFPSPELSKWLGAFRKGQEPTADISGYYCIWPAWDGRKHITKSWPNKRLFFFHRQRVKLIGLCEHGPEPDFAVQKLHLVLFHRPHGASHGLRNIFGKPRTEQARANLARALLGSPVEHPRWRYDSQYWSRGWRQVKDHPILTGLWRLILWPPRQALAMLLAGDFPRPSIFAHAGIFNATVCFEYWRLLRKQSKNG